MEERVTIEAFHAIKGVSYSKLAKLADGPKTYKLSLELKPSGSGLDLGSLVDCLLTNEKGFNEEFYVMTANKPESDMMLKFVEVYANTGNQEEAWKQSGFKINLSRVLDKFNSEGKHYFDSLLIAGNRKVIDANQVMKANQIINELKTNPFVKNYFIPENDDIEIKFQLPLTWNIEVDDLNNKEEKSKKKQITAKAIIDILYFDHKKKQIVIIDLKTGSEGFWKSYWKFRYYLQGSMYYDGISNTILKEYEGYNILPTKFLYADTNMFNSPVIFRMTGSDLIGGKYGYHSINTKTGEMKLKHKGFLQLASELLWHDLNNKWDYPYEVYMSNGEVEIDAYNIAQP